MLLAWIHRQRHSHWFKTVLPVAVLSSCHPLGEPRDIDWRKEWMDHEKELKSLTREVKINSNSAYQNGINDFPGHFDYPFDEGFFIGSDSRDSEIDTNHISIRFYIDRGLLDHFSAFIYTKDSMEIMELERKILDGGNDFKLEEHWYMIND